MRCGEMKQPKFIYHITHVDNLPGILAEGRLWCDSIRVERNLQTTSIAHEHIKLRRLKRDVPVAAHGNLADYVPFNFCFRSVMLYAIYAGAVAQYTDGQNPIVHLVSSVDDAVATGRRWAFTDRHAELAYAQYFDSLEDLDKIDWKVMPLTYWAGSEETKEKRQAEFLVNQWFPWTAVRAVCVRARQTAERVEQILAGESTRPRVSVKPGWYY